MKYKQFISLTIFITFIYSYTPSYGQTQQVYDICVYGGNSAGVIAAYSAKKLNKKVIIIEPGGSLGGLSTGGLGFTDIGNRAIVTGLSSDFYRKVGQYYGEFEKFIFEPKVAEGIFKEYVAKGGLEVIYNRQVVSVQKNGKTITGILIKNHFSDNPAKTAVNIKAKMFIDCSYEGDLMAKAGVSYTIGREANSQYKESINGVQLKNKHQFVEGVDPYKIIGKPESGLLWGISAAPLAVTGSGDKYIQAYNYRICLSSDPNNMLPITKPANYDITKYELLLRSLAAENNPTIANVLKVSSIPNKKTDINNQGAFSTDMIGMNYDYPDADYLKRSVIIKNHEDYMKGLLYFLGNDTRVPQNIRNQMLRLGYPIDEYVNNNHWSPQLYVREARRMVGAYVMTEANCRNKTTVNDAVGYGAYTMDSHNAQRIIVNGMVKNEGDVQSGVGAPYGISYRSIIPKENECDNLLVPVCLSASHIAYGSIRMEPVFMVLGQSAAIAASLAIDSKKSVQQVDVKMIKQILAKNPLMDNSTPEILVDNEDSDQLEINGLWEKTNKGTFGPSVLFSKTLEGEKSSVKFFPNIEKEVSYTICTYLTKIENAAQTIQINIFDGSKNQEITLDIAKIQITGQTRGAWIPLGTFKLPIGKKAFVEITNQAAKGTVYADAVLFVPVKK